MDILQTFKQLYSQFDGDTASKLDQIYTSDIIFTDPIHRIQGLEQVKHYFDSMSDNLISCRFEFVGETVAEDSAWFKWVMHYQHPRLKNGSMLDLTGATYIRFDPKSVERKIMAHEDFYDMGSMLYEHTPLLGTGVRWLKQKLSTVS